MRKIFYLTAAALVAMAMFVACDNEPESPHIPPSVLSLNKSSINLSIGETETLVVTVTTGYAINIEDLFWHSSDSTIAIADNTGKITALSAGIALITVSTSAEIDDEYAETTTCTVIIEGALINGTIWALHNVDNPGTFTANPENPGRFFQWNRLTGWSSTGSVSGWNSNFSEEDVFWEEENDPCPEGWSVPTRDEFASLVSSGSVWTRQNGVNGRLFGVAPNQIFLPAAGFRAGSNGALNGAGLSGYYWSFIPYFWTEGTPPDDILHIDAKLGHILRFYSGIANISLGSRAYGFNVRCVRIFD